MGLFDIFRRNSENKDKEKSSLESLLLENKRKGFFSDEFYAHFLMGDLIILTYNTSAPEGKQDLHQQAALNIVTYPGGEIPIFTRTERIYDRGIISEQVEYIQMKGIDLFSMVKGATFIINPFSDTCKEFLPDEVDSMLNQIENKSALSMVKVSDIQIGQPTEYPNEMINKLSIFFSTRKEVLSAYIGWMFKHEANNEPHYIIGIKVHENSKTLVKAACDIAIKALAHKQKLDIVILNRRSIISDYLIHQTKPFYQRSVQIL